MKFLVICVTQLIGEAFLEMLKHFEVTQNIFEIPHVWEIVESYLVYTKKFSWIIQSSTNTGTIKQN